MIRMRKHIYGLNLFGAGLGVAAGGETDSEQAESAAIPTARMNPNNGRILYCDLM